MFDGLFSSAAPLALAALGALLSELAGKLAIFTEGFIAGGSFFAFFVVEKTHSAFLTCVIIFLGCGLAGWAAARFVRAVRADPFITALAVNIFFDGLTAFLSLRFYGEKGTLRSEAVPRLSALDLPFITPLPVIGKIIAPVSPFALAALLFALGISVFLDRTRAGLRLRASGAGPEAARERGLFPERYLELAWALAAAFAGLAGAALMFRVGAYTPGSSGGRGWIALAAVYLGRKRVAGVLGAALVFAAAERVAFGAQGVQAASATALLGLPSFLALVFFVLSRGGGQGSPLRR